MLILSRRPNEGIALPGLDVLIKVLSVRAGTCRIGLEAPPEVTVLRQELLAEVGDVRKGYLLDRVPRQIRHDILNEINAIQIGLTVISSLANEGKTNSIREVARQLLTQALKVRDQLNATPHPDQSTTPPTSVQPARIEPTQAKSATPPRVLVVEDNDNERELLARLLKISGAKVSTATDGLDALAWLNGHKTPDCIISDMVMPKSDGPALIRSVRSNPTLAAMRFIAVSGLEIQEVPGVSKDDIDAWLLKPLDVDVLLEAVHAPTTTAA